MSIAFRGAALLVTSVVVSVGFGAFQTTSSQAATSSPPVTRPSDFVLPLAHAGAPRAATGPTIPMWSTSITASQNGKKYRYSMVGQNPQVRLAHPTTTIVANIVPIIVKLSDGTTIDPTVKSCGEKVSPLSAVLASPIFNNTKFSPGGTTVGTTQYLDAFQRANFWKYTQPGGINPGYHVLLKPLVGTALTVTVPAADGRAITGSSCTSVAVTMAYAISQGLKLLPALAAKPWNVSPTTFPIFLLHNVEFDTKLGVPGGAVGFHGAVPSPTPAFHGATQTVAVVSYLDPSVAPRESDVAVLSHEVGEWMDDPLGTNPTPPWGHIGQVGACQSNLEVGDPLTGTTFAVTRSGVTYHAQELAFLSWFYGPKTSIGVNGSYSFNDTLTRAAPLCPPGGK